MAAAAIDSMSVGCDTGSVAIDHAGREMFCASPRLPEEIRRSASEAIESKPGESPNRIEAKDQAVFDNSIGPHYDMLRRAEAAVESSKGKSK